MTTIAITIIGIVLLIKKNDSVIIEAKILSAMTLLGTLKSIQILLSQNWKRWTIWKHQNYLFKKFFETKLKI